MRLKMGASIVSSKMGKQKFRVRIAPKDERILADHPKLTALTDPLRVLRDSPPNRPDQTIVCGVVLATHNWVACGECRKWRRLPLDTPCPARGASWSCAMNPDAAHNSCDAPEETYEEEAVVEMEEEMEEEVAVAVEEAPAALQGPMRAFRGLVAWLESPAAAAALLEEAKAARAAGGAARKAAKAARTAGKPARKAAAKVLVGAMSKAGRAVPGRLASAIVAARAVNVSATYPTLLARAEAVAAMKELAAAAFEAGPAIYHPVRLAAAIQAARQAGVPEAKIEAVQVKVAAKVKAAADAAAAEARLRLLLSPAKVSSDPAELARIRGVRRLVAFLLLCPPLAPPEEDYLTATGFKTEKLTMMGALMLALGKARLALLMACFGVDASNGKLLLLLHAELYGVDGMVGQMPPWDPWHRAACEAWAGGVGFSSSFAKLYSSSFGSPLMRMQLCWRGMQGAEDATSPGEFRLLLFRLLVRACGVDRDSPRYAEIFEAVEKLHNHRSIGADLEHTLFGLLRPLPASRIPLRAATEVARVTISPKPQAAYLELKKVGESALQRLDIAAADVRADTPTQLQLKNLSKEKVIQEKLFQAGSGYDRVTKHQLLERPENVQQALYAAVSTAACNGGFAWREMIAVQPGTVALPGLAFGSMRPRQELALQPQEVAHRRGKASAVATYYMTMAEALANPKCGINEALAEGLAAAERVAAKIAADGPAASDGAQWVEEAVEEREEGEAEEDMAGPEGEEEELEAGRGYGAGPRGGDGRRGASTATTSATTTTCRYARVRRSSFTALDR